MEEIGSQDKAQCTCKASGSGSGRLRVAPEYLTVRQESGKLEYHVPASYSKLRPAFSISKTKYDIDIGQHAIGSTLPRADGTVQVSGDTKANRSLFLPENSPTKLEDWLCTDRAQLDIHVVSFEDATLVTVTWLHSLMDAVSLHLLLEAWTAILEGREQDVPEFYGELEDPLATLGVAPNLEASKGNIEVEEFILKDRVVTGWNLVRFVFSMLWDLLVYRKEEIHYVVIPPAFFAALRSEAMSSITGSNYDPKSGTILTADRYNPPTASNPDPPPFLSDGDILCAWWARLITSSLPTLPRASPTRTIQILNVFNMQELLSSTVPALLPKGKSCIHNCVSYVQTFFTLYELLTLPLGHLAARIRSDIVVQTTRPQMEARWRLHRAEYARSGYPPLYGEGDMQMTTFTNWHKARIFDVDFSAAVVGGGDGKEAPVAKPVYAMPDATVQGLPLRMSGNLVGRDSQGHWWVGGILTSETWANVRKALEMYEAELEEVST